MFFKMKNAAALFNLPNYPTSNYKTFSRIGASVPLTI
jgi:hypothetical protein